MKGRQGAAWTGRPSGLSLETGTLPKIPSGIFESFLLIYNSFLWGCLKQRYQNVLAIWQAGSL